MLLVLVLARVPPASAGCSATGVTGSDNAGDCAALLSAYAAWGNKPTSYLGSERQRCVTLDN